MIIMLLIIFITSACVKASDWRLVEKFDNIPHYDIDDVQSIQCPDNNNCFALVDHFVASDAGWRLYNSTDQGRTWKLTHNSNISICPSVEGGQSPYSQYYFIADYYYSKIEKSTDGGLTFKTIILDNSDFGPEWTLDNLTMYDTNYGYVNNFTNYFTTKDGWETFKKHPKIVDPDWGQFFSPIFIDSLSVVMTYVANLRWNDSKGYAFVKYHLNENKWDTLFFFERDSNIYCDYIEHIYFVNDSLGYACGGRGDIALDEGDWWDIIYKTTDGGYNWKIIHKELKDPKKGFYHNISFADENNGIALGVYGKIAMTNDGGETWFYEPTPNEMDNCQKMIVCWAGRTPLIGTWAQGIFRYEGDFFKFPPDTTDVKEILHKTNIITRQSSNKFYISIQDENFRKYKLQICDIYGHIVKEEELNSGIGSLFMPIDISNLTNGAYLYMISTGGVVAKTGKSILIHN